MIIANLIQFDLLFFFFPVKSEGHFAAAEAEARLQRRLGVRLGEFAGGNDA